MAQHIADGEFAAEVLQSDLPVLVDFWADWCAPCKQIAPALEEISAEMQGQLRVVKLDIEANPETPAQYGVRAIPTLILFAGGQPEAVSTGARGKEELVRWIQDSLPQLKA